jgi:hypothetical protein
MEQEKQATKKMQNHILVSDSMQFQLGRFNMRMFMQTNLLHLNARCMLYGPQTLHDLHFD